MIFLAYFLGAGILLFAMGNRAQVRRASAVREQWRRVPGRILEFGVTYGRPQVRYEYEVDNQRYESDCLIPGKRGSGVSGSAPLRKTWMDTYGRLLYPTGAEVIVYHHPDDPNDATLFPGVGYRSWASLPLGLLVIGGTFAAQFAWLELPKHDPPYPIIGMMMLWALLMLLLSFRNFWRTLRGRSFPFVEGRIVKAAPEPTGRGGSYYLAVKYDYTVNGVRFVSGTLQTSGIMAEEHREKVQAKADALLADPRVRVWYDPQKPWVCSIRRARLSGAALPFLAGLFLLFIVRLMLSK